jgi:GntR family transcriptional repressor for pyruvate dehydrogenase complex
MQPNFKAIDRQSASEAVRDELVRSIVSGELEVGEKLPPEAELARSFGVSRPVVREALGSLRALGLIFSRNGRGSFVASARPRRPALLGRYTVDDLHEVRAHLEVPAAGNAALRRSPEKLEELRRLVEALETCTEDDEWTRLDAAFHVALAKATGNEVHASLIEHLRELLVEQSHVVAKTSAGRVTAANREHRAILEAVAAGDGQGAQDAMSTHLLNAYTA